MKQETLFEVGPSQPVEPPVRPLRHPVWTEGKARLIQKYLRFFKMITKHGTYIDAFAGPQEPSKPEMWSAKLVLECEPRWFRHFHLFEYDRAKIQLLEALVAQHRAATDALPRAQRGPRREIEVHGGDCNVELPKLLARRTVRDVEATFCLLDQRTFECEWATVEALAKYTSLETSPSDARPLG